MFQSNSGPTGLAVSTTKTIIELQTGASNIARVLKWWVACDAAAAGTATSALRVQIGLFSAVTGSSTTGPIDKFDGGDGNVVARSSPSITVTTEGTGTPTFIEEHILGLTQSELIVWEPTPRLVAASGSWRIRVISPANIGATNIYAGVAWTE